MVHDPHAAYALLLHLGCPEDRLDSVFGPLLGQDVPYGATDTLAMLRAAMRSQGIEPTS